ncbi:MAG: N-acetyltransferase [Planctomycetes bacterium]|nr:N-acetyltransferase [Planctomycetota bacterium]
MDIEIRLETLPDRLAIQRIHLLAFASPDEARLVEALRIGRYVRVSLVAEVLGQIVGHVLFSDLPIHTGKVAIPALALAPLAVLPDFQRRGIGSAIVRIGLDECRKRGHKIAVVLGKPSFYQRFGFSAELAKRLDSPFAGEAFMAVELIQGALEGVRGQVRYPPPFGAF